MAYPLNGQEREWLRPGSFARKNSLASWEDIDRFEATVRQVEERAERLRAGVFAALDYVGSDVQELKDILRAALRADEGARA